MTNETKQTAVEWLIEQLEEKGDARETPSIRNIKFKIDTSDYLILKIQAKAMEKEQHSKTWNNALEAFEKKLELLKQTYGGNK